MNNGRLLNDSEEIIIDTVYRAESSLERMKGLLGRSELLGTEGFWIEPCNSVHTLFMRYPIDVLFLDRNGVVIKIMHELMPWKFSGALHARVALELREGSALRLGLKAGERLVWQAEVQ